MDIEITLERIKVTTPRVHFMIEGPRILPRTPEQIEQDKLMDEAADVYNATLDKIYGKPDKIFMGASWHFEDWLTERYQLTLALGLDNFREWYRHVIAEAYAMHLSEVRDKAIREPEKNDKS